MTKLKKPIIGIIGGTSQFGQWFRFFFEKNGCECLVASSTTKLTPKALAKKADIVIVSVPVTETAKVIKSIRGLLKPDALLCDLTSLKKDPMKEMMKRKQGGVLGMHPLFGPLVPNMEGQIIVFCEGRKNKWVGFLKKMFELHNAKIVYIDPREHDKQMAMIQAMTHFVNIVFAKVLQKQKMEPQNVFATPVFRLQAILMGRILGANLPLYASFQTENNEYRKILKDFIKEADSLSSKILSGKLKYTTKEFVSAAKAMKTFIPIAQAKTTEIMYLLDKQPVEVKEQRDRSTKIGQKGTPIACLGPEGTFSHLASLRLFPSKAKIITTHTIRQVFKAVGDGNVKFGVVPAENLTAGIVQETLDALLDYPLNVIGSYKMEIHHCLLARTSNWGKIETIKSHIQPLNQCKEWLSRNFPKAILTPEASPTEAILSTKDPSVAFIGSKDAAKKYGLKTLAHNIEDNRSNFTEFYVLSKGVGGQISKDLKAKRTILIITVYDRPGILRDVL
ncbi:MAG TPA: prephenate dehydrogenase/arogenate dehydrogenase family protein, partial [Candidatus Moranbacteria bacterium]|nr:prephenate dehydrogenase/arogenate dehydrogenase family protein [Candidatus Moranbacteria bacterium]